VYDVAVVGGGFAGVTAAREAALQGRSVLLLEACDRLGGRTWSTEWEPAHPARIEYGGAWIHWHQPHTWSELSRAGLAVTLGDDAEVAAGMSTGSGARAPSPSAMRSPGAAGTRS
jgi:monoamine oxidase